MEHLKRNSSCIHALKLAGLKVTQLRLAVLDLLHNSEAPQTIPSFQEHLERDYSLTPNKTSLYRDMERLAAAGLVEAVSAGGRASAYKQASVGHHHHLICRECQKVVDIEVPTLEAALGSAEKELSRSKGFAAVSHDVTFVGTCTDCT